MMSAIHNCEEKFKLGSVGLSTRSTYALPPAELFLSPGDPGTPACDSH